MAPLNDLELLKDLLNYKTVNSVISAATFKTFSRHLWYISSELAGLAFFDEQVTVAEKKIMVEALRTRPCIDTNHRIKVEKSSVDKKKITDFINVNSQDLFTKFSINTEFMLIDPSLWANDKDYKEALEKIKSLKVVNDVAERHVALAEKYNTTLVKDETQKQFLFQGVEHHRKLISKVKKETIMTAVKKEKK